MEIVLNEYVLRVIFQHLNGVDLNNAAKVNRTWNKIANEEYLKRGPCCISKDYFTGLPQSWEDMKRDIIDECKIKPMLQITYTSKRFSKNFLDGCICRFLPRDCHSILVENYYISDEDEIVNNMFFPNIPNAKICTLTFNVHAWEYGIYCDEINFLFDLYFNNDESLRNLYEPFFNNDNNLTNCLILLYEETKEFIASNIVRSLHKWYPGRISSIWGGLVKKLSICKTIEESSVCKYGADCISVLISGTNIQTWNLTLDGKSSSLDSIEKQFRALKDKVTLKKHSLCLMFSSDYCDNYYLNLECPIFKRFFPNTPLFQILGYLSLGAIDFQEAEKKISDGYRRMLELSLMILTYD